MAGAAPRRLRAISRGLDGLRHHRVGQVHSEPLLEAEQQLDALEAADAQVAIESIVESDRPVAGSAAELIDQGRDDGQDVGPDRSRILPDHV